VRPSFDTNILIYAIGQTAPGKKLLAQRLIARSASLNGIITQQVYGEFLNLCINRPNLSQARARDQIDEWQEVFSPVLTTAKDQLAAYDLANRFKLHYWDALILHVSAQAGCDILFSEDLPDSFVANGLRVVNPFEETNSPFIHSLLTS
jgi:predicted nucleic acid-binding protein